ncbi:MAG: TIGR03668 family PPOX class F420-dependent oxidoreductase [Actinomycetia bacterium]|nr:TIGR03668 family PPOX class F420-dependent oxidoreductase [Actinomycetes bacterium]
MEHTRSATLGTVDDGGRPHLVPIVFGYRNGRLCTAVDQKPKSTYRLKRIRNIETNPQVSVLLDHYDNDWARLWWIRIDGTARLLGSGPGFDEGIALLTHKYPPYLTQPPPGPLVEVEVESIRAWSAT